MHEYNPALTTDDWLQYKPLHIRAIQIRICDLPAYLLTLELLTSHFYFSLNINANSPRLSRSLQATEKISWSLSSIYHHFLSYNFIFPFPAVRLEVKIKGCYWIFGMGGQFDHGEINFLVQRMVLSWYDGIYADSPRLSRSLLDTEPISCSPVQVTKTPR